MKRPAAAFALLALVVTATSTADAAPPKSPRLSVTLATANVVSAVNRLARVPVPVPGSAPLGSSEAIVPLAVPGFGEAMVSLPLGARGPKPVVVVAHGNHDDPGSHCNAWREIVGNSGFVLCPRGTLRTDSKPGEVSYTHGKELPAEIEAGVAALHARYGALVDPGPMIYVGFSQGAYLGSIVVSRDPAHFSRVVLIEGNGGWNEKTFAKSGGQRVLFACGRASCVKSAQPFVSRFEHAGVRSKVVYGEGAGHTYGGAVGDALKAQWPWVIEGDRRWG